jgi:hypothetical protein
MSDLLDMQVRYYPEILRRMAAGEKLSTASGEEEKLAAAILVAEALENEKRAEADPSDGQEKKAIEVGLGTLSLLGLAVPTALRAGKKIIQKARGEAAIPEEAGELLKSFKKLVEEREKTQAAKRMAIAAGLGGAAVGALATKALEKKDEPSATKKSSESNRIEEAKLAEGEGTKEPEATEQSSAAPGSPNARALLDKVLKNLQ